MRIYLMRHGDAVAGGERPLSDRGILETRSSAEGLKSLNIKPSYIIHSPLVRAVQTAEIVTNRLSIARARTIKSEALAPGHTPNEILQELRRVVESDDSDILVIGHLPDLGELITYLIYGEPVKEIPLKKSSVTLVEAERASLRSGTALLRWMLTAEHLAFIARNPPVD